MARLEQHTPALDDTTWDNITNATSGGTGVLLVENGTTDATIAVMAPPIGTIIFEKAA